MPGYTRLKGVEGVTTWDPKPRRLREHMHRYVALNESGKSITGVAHSWLAGPSLYPLLDQMLRLNPNERLSAEAALMQRWFWEDPMPADPRSCVCTSRAG
jgi:serine/threonine-protein kinase BUR1